MGTEIERKYLVISGKLPELGHGRLLRQGYVKTGSFVSVRAGIRGDAAFLTLKGPSSEDGLSRREFEYEIPVGDAHQIIAELCDGGTVEKTRYEVPVGGLIWEVDVFGGANRGLVMAEVELPDADTVPELPDWAGEELTGDARYYNMNLAVHPWSEWKDRG